MAAAFTAEAVSPTVSISLVPPASLQLSWPSNYVGWQLTAATDLSSAHWQALTQPPTNSGNALVVLLPLTNVSSYFRLEQTGGGCLFQAMPPVILASGSSTLSWCPVTGTIYSIFPGAGVVAGGSLIVKPIVTTVYTLIASNALGVVTNFVTVVVNPCGFLNVTNWDATLDFSYALAPSTSQYSFNVSHQAQLTCHLTLSQLSGTTATFKGAVSGTATMNDVENDMTFSPGETTTVAGSGPPLPSSSLILIIDCTSNAYACSAVVQMNATETIDPHVTPPAVFPTIGNVGLLVVLPRPLPLADNTISDSDLLPARGPLWTGGGSYYTPDDIVPNNMWIYGVVTDTTAGNASVSWSFTPAP